MEKSRERKYEGYFSVDALQVECRSGKMVTREVMNRKDGVCALVIDTNTQEFIFVKQYRPGVGDSIIEVPAGTLDVPDEDPSDAMVREIDEEIGYKVDSIDYVSKCYMSPGGSTEMLYNYIAFVSEKLHDGGGTENEDIDIVRMSIKDTENIIDQFVDAKTILLLKSFFLN